MITDQSLSVLSTNCRARFCANFITVMPCPIFLGRPDYLGEVIRAAMWYRLGDVVLKPRFRSESDPNLQFPEHKGFVKFLPSIAKIFGSDHRRGLVTRDLVAMIDAWDEYAEKEDLKIMKGYQKETRNSRIKLIEKHFNFAGH